MGNGASRETLTLSAAVLWLGEQLPSTWRATLDATTAETDQATRTLLTLTDPTERVSQFMVVALSPSRFSAAVLVDLARQRAATAGLPGLVVVEYANPRLRDACLQTGLNYLDRTGWTYLRDDLLGLFIKTQGADRAPGPARPSAMSRLSGPGATRVVEALFDAPFPLGIRELATRAGVSPGTAAKALPTLDQAGVTDRALDGRLLGCDRAGLIARWTQDYSFERSNADVQWLLAPRGVDGLLELLSEPDPSFARANQIVATGSLAARQLLPEDMTSVIPLSLVALYCQDPSAIAAQWRLRPATRGGANVVLARPRDEQLLSRTSTTKVATAPPARVIGDLLSLGGRFVDAGEQLLDTLVSPAAGARSKP